MAKSIPDVLAKFAAALRDPIEACPKPPCTTCDTWGSGACAEHGHICPNCNERAAEKVSEDLLYCWSCGVAT